MGKMITVKKYSNRRLYDTSKSCYVTLEELAETIRGGADVRVIDAKSNAELTQQVLAQIILESRGAASMLPVPLLTQLIRMGDDSLTEFFGRYMGWALETYMLAKRNARNMAKLNPLGQIPMEVFRRLFAQQQQNMSWNQDPSLGFPPPPPVSPDLEEPEPPTEDDSPPELAPPAEPAAATPASEPSNSDVAELREELNELKTLMRALVQDRSGDG